MRYKRRNRSRLAFESLEAKRALTALGAVNSGIAVDDVATGVGYLMYSAQDVHTRFSPPPVIANSDNLIAVRYSAGQWQYNDNSDWYSFTPVPSTDRLLAEVDFSADTINSFQCVAGSINGINHGFANDDLQFVANEWNEKFNTGEFTVYGTSFDTTWTNCASLLAIDSDSGPSSTDFVTNDTSLVLTGRYDPQGSLRVRVNADRYNYNWPSASDSSELTVSGENWTLDLTGSPLAEGTHVIKVDVDGTNSVVTEQVVVDTTLPNAAITGIVQDTGSSSTDFVTTDTRLLVVGDQDPGSDLVVTFDGTPYTLGENPQLTSNAGVWVLDVTALQLAGGTYTLEATATDLAGNSDSVSENIQVITATIDSVTDDTGVDDFVTQDQQVILSGTVTPGATITIDIPGVGTGMMPVVSGGSWTLDLTGSTLPFAMYDVTANVSLNGDSASVSQSLHITNDCFYVDSYELRDPNDNPISSLATVTLDPSGVPSVAIDLNARKTPTSNVFYVDSDYQGSPSGSLGSQTNPYDNIDTAFAAIDAISGLTAATINVADGEYIWGYQNNIGFDLNIIGAGVGQTIVVYDETAGTDPNNSANTYTAQFRQNSTYIEGITFDGDDDNNSATPSNSFIVLDVRNADSLTIVDSEFRNAGSGDGLNVFNTDTVVVVGSTAHDNAGDGFSYSNPDGTPMEVFEWDVNGSDNGYVDADNDNDVDLDDFNLNWNVQGSTTHESVDIVRVGGVFERNPTNISDVSNGTSWNVDVTTGFARANEQAGQFLNFNVSGGGTAWMIGGDHGGRFASNRPTVVNAQPGAEIRYVSEFNTLDPVSTILTGVAVEDNQVLVPNSVPCVASVSIDSISQDTGDATDFVTYDQELVINGSFVGNDVSVTFDGATYTSASPELTIDGFEWSLDLTAITLSHGTYAVSATATDASAGTATTNTTVTIDCTTPVDAYLNAVLSNTRTALTVDSQGRASVDLDLDARKVSSTNVFYVDASKTVLNPDGSQALPFNDLPDVFDHIKMSGYQTAEIYVAEGAYAWGDAINPDTETVGPFFDASLTIIGAGPNLTKVYQRPEDKAAGLFSEGGKSLYVEGISFLGLGDAGVNNVNEHAFEATGGADLTFVDTVFTNASDGDGLFVGNFETVVVYDSKAIRNDADGFSYTKPADGDPSMYVIEIGALAAANGQNGEASSQGSTAHRDTRIVRVNGTYANNPTNIEDTNLVSWNVNLDVKDPTVYQPQVGDYVNLRARGDKIEATNGQTWLVSGSYNQGGVVHARETTANDPANTTIEGRIRYTSLFDIVSHPIGSVLTEDVPGLINTPADDSQLYFVAQPCDHFLTLEIDAAWIPETGSATGTITRHSGADISRPLFVNLAADDVSELDVPSVVRIPAGELSTQFVVTGVNDHLLDGTQTVTVTATAPGYISDGGSADAVDVVTLSPVAIRVAPREVAENSTTSAFVTRTNSDTSQTLTVSLTVDDDSEVSVPSSVTIPAGQMQSASFTISGINDGIVDGDQIASVSASVVGYETETLTALADGILLYTFDSGFPEDSIGLREADLLDGATLRDDAEMGTVLSVDGTYARLQLDHDSELNLGAGNADFSLAYWVKLEESHNGSFRLLTQKGSNGSQRTFAMWARPNDNRITYRISTTHSSNEGGVSNGALPVGQWTHIAYVKTGNTLQLYLDGALDSQRTLIGATVANTGIVQIGGTGYNAWQGARASYDDYYIVDRALTGAEVTQLSDQHQDTSQGFGVVESLAVASYDFNGDVTDTTSSFDGTLVGGASLVSDAQFGDVLSVGGTDRLEIAHDEALAVGASNSDFSLAFWVKLEEGHDGTFRLLTQKGSNGSERTFAMWARPNDNRFIFRISTTESTNEGGISNAALVVGEWTHITYVKEHSTLSLYVNGELDATATLQGDTISNSGVIQIGGTSYGAWLGADALYDDYLILSDALAADQVSLLASQHDPNRATQRLDVIDTNT